MKTCYFTNMGSWKERREAFYKDVTWKDCSEAYREAHPLCERCLAKHEIKPSAETHHKIKLTPNNIDDPSIVLNWDNLEALCVKCHKDEHNKERAEKKLKKRRWMVKESGEVILSDPPGVDFG